MIAQHQLPSTGFAHAKEYDPPELRAVDKSNVNLHRCKRLALRCGGPASAEDALRIQRRGRNSHAAKEASCHEAAVTSG